MIDLETVAQLLSFTMSKVACLEGNVRNLCQKQNIDFAEMKIPSKQKFVTITVWGNSIGFQIHNLKEIKNNEVFTEENIYSLHDVAFTRNDFIALLLNKLPSNLSNVFLENSD